MQTYTLPQPWLCQFLYAAFVFGGDSEEAQGGCPPASKGICSSDIFILSVILQLLFVRAQSLSPGCLCWAQDVQGITNCRLIILSWKGNCKVSFKYLIVRHGKNTYPKGKGYRMMVCQKLVQYVDVGSPELKFQTQGTSMIS